jgi:hypothetical protein
MALFSSDGRPAAKSKLAEESEAVIGEPEENARSITRIAPGQAIDGTFNLNRWVKIDKEGTYYLVAMRRIWSWDSGFVISNLITIQVTK